MTSVIIDPAIIQLPSEQATREEVEKWLETLECWLKEALTAPFVWLHYQQASQLLEANGHFPSFLHLSQLQQKYHLDINVSQIARNVNNYFRDNNLDVEDYLNTLDYAVEMAEKSIFIKPEQFITRLPTYLHEGLSLLFANLCTCKYIEHPFGKNLYIATLVLTDGSREIAISCVVLDILPDFPRPLDNKITQKISLLITPDDLQPLTDVVDVWAKGEQAIIHIIEKQYKKDQPNADFSMSILRLGPRFIKSVNERELDTNGVILQSIIRAASNVVADRAKDISGYKLHPYRQSEAADSPQLIRNSDHARAWRLMLQKGGAGWRLHYWQVPTAQGYEIELANVCKESERIIY
jgi:hypothetical protein